MSVTAKVVGAKRGHHMKSAIIGLIGVWAIAGSASAQTLAKGFHEGLEDCVEAVMNPDRGLTLADEVHGDWDAGFIAWYNDENGTSLFGTRMAKQDTGDEVVHSCTAPPAMGPFEQDYVNGDASAVYEFVTSKGFVQLQVPISGDYFANCRDENPSVLIAIQFDDTARTGFKVVNSFTVAESCAKFGPQ